MKKILVTAVIIAALALGFWADARSLAVVLLARVPRGVAVKLVQGLVAVQGIGAVEIDHRNGRYREAFEHLRSDYMLKPPADSSAVAITEVGTRFLGENALGSFGTLMGYSVSMGGDVDGRLGDEVVAGGYEYSDRYEERGMVLVLARGRLPIKIYGPRQHRAWFGHSVANNGDFDGDGLNDVLVGARFAHGRSGAAYLIPSAQLQGKTDSLEVDTARSVVEFVADGVEAELGFEVYFGDDWDGDGRAELVLRAHIDGEQSGGVYVVYSSKVKTKRVELGKGINEIQVVTGEDYADLGRTISLIGDLDGDGLDELLLGAQAASRYFDSATYVPSRFYVVLSSDLGRQVEIDREQMYSVTELNEGEQLGSCTGRLGDVDGDGVDDFAVGARYLHGKKGGLYIVSGAELLKRDKGVEIKIDNVSPLHLVGEKEGDMLGWSCAEASADFDGDEIVDIVVGARAADGYIAGAGAVYVVAGAAIRSAIAAGVVEFVPSGDGTIKIGGDRHGARLGSKRRFAAAGDYDGDGRADIAVGTPGWHEGGIYAGAVWVLCSVVLQ